MVTLNTAGLCFEAWASNLHIMQVAGKAIEAENEAAHVKAAQSAPASASPISVPFAQTSAQLRTPAPVGSHQPSRLSLSSARSRLQSASIQPQQQQQTPRDAQPEAQQQQQQHRFELCPPQQGSASQEQQHQQQRHRMSPVDVSRSSVAADNMRQEATSLSASEPTPQVKACPMTIEPGVGACQGTCDFG